MTHQEGLSPSMLKVKLKTSCFECDNQQWQVKAHMKLESLLSQHMKEQPKHKTQLSDLKMSSHLSQTIASYTIARITAVCKYLFNLAITMLQHSLCNIWCCYTYGKTPKDQPIAQICNSQQDVKNMCSSLCVKASEPIHIKLLQNLHKNKGMLHEGFCRPARKIR